MITMASPIRIGVIGANPDGSWASMSHLPALQALPQYELVAVSTTRMETARQSAVRYGARLAFDDPNALINHPDVDMVTVSLRTPKHREFAMAVAAAGKHVFCEWPLGATLQQSEEMAAAVRGKPFRSVVGLQGRMSPWLNAIRDIVRSGRLGRILSTSVVASGVLMGPVAIPRGAFTLDHRNGSTMLTISFGHMLDSVMHCLGELTELSSLLTTQRPEVRVAERDELLPMTASDQIAMTGLLEGGAVASFHMRGGVSRGTNFLWEINGTEGDLVITSDLVFVHLGELKLQIATGDATALEDVKIDPGMSDVPASLLGSQAYNPACLYAAFARDLRGGTRTCPDFDAALSRHRLLDLIHRSNKTRSWQPTAV
jgi:predicted dehydrogenase